MQIGYTPITNVLSNLPQDIYKVLEGGTVFDSSIVERFGDRIKDLLTQRLSREHDDASPILRMSNLGRPLRQLYYELNKYPKEKVAGKALYKFLFGDLIEATTIALAEAAGYEVTDYQKEVEVDGVPGHIDLRLNGILVDVKSTSPYGFTKFKDGSLLEGDNDAFGYVGQLSGYAHALESPAAWIAVNKVDGEICVLDLPQERANEYDVKSRIDVVREATKQDIPPERCYSDEPEGKSGNMKLSIGCSYCAWKEECWKDSNSGKGLQVYLYSSGPKFLTNVAVEPRVFKKETNS